MTVFLPKTLPYFFEMQEKLKTCRNSNLRDFRRSSLGDYIHVTEFTQPYICYKLYLTKKTF